MVADVREPWKKLYLYISQLQIRKLCFEASKRCGIKNAEVAAQLRKCTASVNAVKPATKPLELLINTKNRWLSSMHIKKVKLNDAKTRCGIGASRATDSEEIQFRIQLLVSTIIVNQKIDLCWGPNKFTGLYYCSYFHRPG